MTTVERAAPAPALGPRAVRRRYIWAGARVCAGAGVLAWLVWRVGTGPFLDGIRRIDTVTVLAALCIGVVTTVCCALRWRLIVAALGGQLALRAAVAAYYRSQFLNTALPGGILGDVHRALRHGRAIADLGLGVRAVFLDRAGGQLVQVTVAAIVLSVLPSPAQPYAPAALAGVAVLGAGLALVRLRRRGRGGLPRPTWVAVAVLSTWVLSGYVATFVLAARTAGVAAPVMVLVPLTLLALLAMVVPLNVAGWGPREGVAAWAFSAAGLTAAQGVAASVTYGALVLVAALPGAVVLLARSVRRVPAPAVALQEGVPGA